MSETAVNKEEIAALRAEFGIPENEPVRIRYDVVAASVRYLRNKKGWRQFDLARYAAVSESTVSGIEIGRRTQLLNLKKIALALEVSPLQLVSGEYRDDDSELSEDAIDIAREFERATPAVQIVIKRLLQPGVNQIADRFARLEKARQDQVLNLIGLLESNQTTSKTRAHSVG